MTELAVSTEPHVIEVRAESGRPAIDFRELARSGDLLWSLADRDIRVRYKQTALGVVWVILQPLLAAMIFSFVFGVVANLSADGVPYILFAFAGMTAWTTFATTLQRVSNSLVGNAPLVSKIYFPRLILPLSALGSPLLDFVVSLGMMGVLMAFYRVVPGWPVLLLPVWLTVLMAIAMGVGMMAGALTVTYRDIGIIVPVMLQLGMYVTPVAWPSSMVPGRFRWVLAANPLAGLMDAFRWSLLGQSQPSPAALAYSIAAAVLLCWAGAVVFKQQEQTFADVL